MIPARSVLGSLPLNTCCCFFKVSSIHPPLNLLNVKPLQVEIDWIDVTLQKERGPNGLEVRTWIWLWCFCFNKTFDTSSKKQSNNHGEETPCGTSTQYSGESILATYS